MTDVVSTPTDMPAPLQKLPLTLSIRLGTARWSVKDVMAMREGSLVELDARLEDPLEICIEDRVVARGTLIELSEGEGLGVRITDVIGE